MAANPLVQARITVPVKGEATTGLADMALTVSDAVRPMLPNGTQETALPFAPLIPSAVAIQAMNEPRKSNLPRSGRVQALLEDLHARD